MPPSIASPRRSWWLVCVLAVLSVLAIAAPAHAQDGTAPADVSTTTVAPAPGGSEDAVTAIKGTLKAGGDPVEGAVIAVTDPAGAAVGEATTDAEGAWMVPVEAAGPYLVKLDPASLPTGVTLRAPDRNPLTIVAQAGRSRAALFGLKVGEGAVDRTPRASRAVSTASSDFADRFVDGIVFGLILAVASIGLSLIFGTTKLVNFAHGEMVAFGAILAWFLSSEGPRLSVIVAGLIALVGGAFLGGVQELGLWRPLRKRKTGQFQILVVSIGLSIVARQALLIWFGTGDKRYRQYVIQRDSWSVGPFEINARDLSILVICIVVLVGVALMLNYTRVGKALRAVSDNPDLAASSGINVQRIILFVWVLGGALAAGGGVLQGVASRVDYLMGFQLLLLMFAAVILGGLGTAYGAMVGGLVVGLTTELSTLFISPELKRVAALSILIIVLLVRPQGLLGSKDRVG